MTDNSHIFLSYRSMEADFAIRFATDLKNAGVNIWMDRLDGGISPGDDWRREIENAVDTCSAMIAVLSPDYVAAKYCLRELARADTRGIAIIPILLRSVAAREWPIEIQRSQYIDFRSWQDEVTYRSKLDELVKRLRVQMSTLVGNEPDRETRYLNTLIAELESRKGVLEYVELAAQVDNPDDHAPVRPSPTLTQTWGLDNEFSLLEVVSQWATPVDLQPVQQRKRQLGSILDAVHEHRRFVLIGAPGAGKTTTIRRLALDAARARLNNPHSSPLPILLPLSLWKNEATPLEFLQSHLPLDINLSQLLTIGGVYIFLDGLNEMGEDYEQKASILRKWLLSEESPLFCIITCRAMDYQGSLVLDLPTVLAEEMDTVRIQRFVANYLQADAKPFLSRISIAEDKDTHHNNTLVQLSRNPYLLTALMVIYRSMPNSILPRNTGLLFKYLVQTLWERERQRQTQGWVPFDKMEEAFSYIAFTMIKTEMPTQVSDEWILQQFKGEKWQDWSVTTLLNLLHVGHSANLLEVSHSGVRFYHQLVQEYFAALSLTNLPLHTVLKFPDVNAEGQRRVTKWDQAIIALSGITMEADRTICAISTIDPFIAAACISSGVHVSESTFQQLGTALTSGLNNHNFLYRLASIKALEQLGSIAISYLRPMLHDEHWVIRQAAIETMGQIADSTTLPDLSSALTDKHKRVRCAAARALGQLNIAAAVPPLIYALTDEDWDVQLEADLALLRIHDPASVHILIDILLNEQKSRREGMQLQIRVAEMLKRFRTPEALAALEQWRSRKYGS